MISGNISGLQNSLEKTLSGTISVERGLTGKVSVSVRDVPYYETSNESGGITVYIGKEVVNHGI